MSCKSFRESINKHTFTFTLNICYTVISNNFPFVSATPYGNLEDLYNPDYEDYDENNEVSEEADDAVLKPPGFVSSSVDLVVNEGETIRLPCIVTRWVAERRGSRKAGIFYESVTDCVSQAWQETNELLMMKHFSIPAKFTFQGFLFHLPRVKLNSNWRFKTNLLVSIFILPTWNIWRVSNVFIKMHTTAVVNMKWISE